jgi:hypothetical protein
MILMRKDQKVMVEMVLTLIKGQRRFLFLMITLKPVTYVLSVEKARYTAPGNQAF